MPELRARRYAGIMIYWRHIHEGAIHSSGDVSFRRRMCGGGLSIVTPRNYNMKNKNLLLKILSNAEAVAAGAVLVALVLATFLGVFAR